LHTLKELAADNETDKLVEMLHELVPEFGEMENVEILKKIKTKTS